MKLKLLACLFSVIGYLYSYSSLSQCLDDDIIMFPPKSTSFFSNFGWDVVLQDNYLITSAINNDSIAYQSGIVFVYEFVDASWQRIAELIPSSATKGMQLGYHLAANSNTIVARATTYSPEGYAYEMVYVFEKNEGETWTSRNESYIINPVPVVDEDDFGGVDLTFEMTEEIISVYYYYGHNSEEHHEVNINIYQLNDGSASLIETLDGIKSESDSYFHPLEVNLKFGDNFLVAAADNFQISGEYASGRVFVYNNDESTGWEHDPVELLPSRPNQLGFGTSIAVLDDHIFVANNRDEGPGDETDAKVFIYERADGKWVDANEIAVLSIPGIEGSTNDRVVANDQYVIHSHPAQQTISVFKKGSDWSNVDQPDFVLDIPSIERGFGWEMSINEDHFVYNSNDFAYSDNIITGSELNTVVLDEFFESSQGDSDQVLFQHSLSSSGDEFSNSSSFYKLNGAVGTNLDDDRGWASGAVNIYERNNEDLSWSRTTKIYSPDIQSFQNFGRAIEITDNYLFASSPFYDSTDVNGNNVINDMGKVYQFEKNGDNWEFVQEIISPDVSLVSGSSHKSQISDGHQFGSKPNPHSAESLDVKESFIGKSVVNRESTPNDNAILSSNFNSYRQFGRTITHHKGYLAVGQRYFGGSNYKGRIYIFKEDDQGMWDYLATLQASDQYSRDAIGEYPIFMNDTLVVAGSPVYGNTVLIFKRKPDEEWMSGTEDARLLPDRSELIETGNYAIEEFDSFGTSVDLYGEYIVVGAPTGERDDRLGPNSGRAYLFKMPEGGWEGEIQYQNILKPEERIIDGFFGNSVYIDQNNVLVGAPHSLFRRSYTDYYNTEDGEEPGKVYVFDRNFIDESVTVANEVGEILPIGGHEFDGFGATITKNFLEVVVSAPLADTENGDRSGAAYMFKKVGAIEEDIPPLCVEDGIVDLIAYPVSGGTWSGEGIIDTEAGLFDPSTLAEDKYTIRYQYGECTTTTTIDVYTKPIVLNASEPENYLCIGETFDLFMESNKPYHSYRWYYKENLDGVYSQEYKWDGQDTVSVDKAGYYYGISLNPACNSDPQYFQVIDAIESTALKHPNNVTYCTGETFPLELESENVMESYTWYYSADTITINFESISDLPDLQGSNAGLYYCQFMSKGCVYNSDTINIKLNTESSSLNYTGEYELCLDESITLSLQSGSMNRHEWYGDLAGFGTYELLSDESELLVGEAGSYYCKSFSASGCTYLSDTLRVNHQIINLEFESIGIVCDASKTVNLVTSPSGGTFEIINTNLGAFREPVLDIMSMENGTYTIRYEVEINECTYQISQDFEVNVSISDDLMVPNVFTPNNDGINDLFFIQGVSSINVGFQFTIVNRAGSIIFRTNNPDFKWTGKGHPGGVYYWSMSIEDNCRSNQMKGYLHLLR